MVVVVIAVGVTVFRNTKREGEGEEEEEWWRRGLTLKEESEVEHNIVTHLHNSDGTLTMGWSRRPLFQVDWSRVHAHRHRHKVWEHYTFFSPSLAGHLTITDLGIVTLAAIELFNLVDGEEVLMRMEVLPPSSVTFPLDVSSDLFFRKGDCTLSMTKRSDSTRHVKFSFPHAVSCYSPSSSSTLSGDILFQEVSPEALAIVVPFKDRSLFFYEYKMPALTIARGHITFPTFHVEFDESIEGKGGEREEKDGDE